MHVSALNAQRTAYRKLADDNASILKKLGELKSAGTSEVRASVFECLPRLRVSEMSSGCVHTAVRCCQVDPGAMAQVQRLLDVATDDVQQCVESMASRLEIAVRAAANRGPHRYGAVVACWRGGVGQSDLPAGVRVCASYSGPGC